MSDELITLEHLHWLTEHGRELMHAAGQPTSRQPDLPATLLAKLESWQQSLLQQQYELRWRSRHRFLQPELWLWTERSLAQASDYWSAHYKAKLFPPTASVLDACCGAGSDLVALASRDPVHGSVCGSVRGIEGHPGLAHLAADNARAHGYQVQVDTHTLTAAWQGAVDWLSIDPDRRAAGRRTTDADEFSPTLTDVLSLTKRTRGAIVKLAPSTRMPAEQIAQIDHTSQRVWLGNQGECRQQLLLSGELRQGTSRQAVLCEPSCVSEFSGSSQPPVRITNAPLRYIYELHNVLHAAELQATWANQQPMDAVGDSHGYYTADQLVHSEWAQVFEVLEVLPWDDRQLRKWLRKRRVGTVEVKTRGLGEQATGIDANACQRRYSAPEGEPVSLLVTRLGGRVRGIAARRLG